MIIKAKQYASALYEIGKKRGILKEFLDGLTLAKDGLVKQKFNIPQNIDNYLANFFNLLFENKDLLKLKNIYYEFEKIYNNENNIANVEITLACKPQKEEKEILERSLKSSLNKNITANYIVNPEILGGITIKIGDKLIDNSLHNKLKIFQKELEA